MLGIGAKRMLELPVAIPMAAGELFAVPGRAAPSVGDPAVDTAALPQGVIAIDSDYGR